MLQHLSTDRYGVARRGCDSLAHAAQELAHNARLLLHHLSVTRNVSLLLRPGVGPHALLACCRVQHLDVCDRNAQLLLQSHDYAPIHLLQPPLGLTAQLLARSQGKSHRGLY